jgi:hypothetical protein
MFIGIADSAVRRAKLDDFGKASLQTIFANAGVGFGKGFSAFGLGKNTPLIWFWEGHGLSRAVRRYETGGL